MPAAWPVAIGYVRRMTGIRPAISADLSALHRLVERAYRGDAARGGWTHEADLVDGPRTDAATLAALVAAANGALLVVEAGDGLAGCVTVTDMGGGVCTLGMLAVDPAGQARGIGRRLVAAAEDVARTRFGATMMEMTVVSVRAELIAWYERRGYRVTGERRPFVVPVDPPLEFVVMVRPLAMDAILA